MTVTVSSPRESSLKPKLSEICVILSIKRSRSSSTGELLDDEVLMNDRCPGPFGLGKGLSERGDNLSAGSCGSH